MSKNERQVKSTKRMLNEQFKLGHYPKECRLADSGSRWRSDKLMVQKHEKYPWSDRERHFLRLQIGRKMRKRWVEIERRLWNTNLFKTPAVTLLEGIQSSIAPLRYPDAEEKTRFERDAGTTSPAGLAN
jgi:hypothetical protein